VYHYRDFLEPKKAGRLYHHRDFPEPGNGGAAARTKKATQKREYVS
jgi:hypothetical protein